jgi:hypothetical protein
MRFDTLYLWFLGDPQTPRCVGTLRLVEGERESPFSTAAIGSAADLP